MLINDLEKLGLTEKEAKIYLTLLELGEGGIEKIAKKSGIRRTTVYDVIDSLKKQGLISSIKRKKRTVFMPEEPKKIGENFDEKKMILTKIMPELISLANVFEKKPKIRFFEGVEGIKEVYRDTLEFEDQEVVSWFTDSFITFDKKFFDNYYIPKRLEKKIWVRAIVPDTDLMRSYLEFDREQLRQTKRIPREKAIFKVEISLYGGSRIGIMSFKEQIALIIESKDIYETLKAIFEMHWESIK